MANISEKSPWSVYSESITLQEKLRKLLKRSVEITINDNRSTMLSVLEKSARKYRLSIHQMFLEAPDEVLIAVADYCKGSRGKAPLAKTIIRRFINTNSLKERRIIIDPKSLVHKGKVYHLTRFYEELNGEYFDHKLSLHYSWYFGWGKNNKAHILFGQYRPDARLIRINTLLDDPFFPEFFVRFIFYHEMVHAHVPSYTDSKGRCISHGPEFKAQERLYKEYEKARAWEKKHRKHFFGKGALCGR